MTDEGVVHFLNRFEELAEKEDFSLVQGRGTPVLVKQQGRRQIIHEHLGRFPKAR